MFKYDVLVMSQGDHNPRRRNPRSTLTHRWRALSPGRHEQLPWDLSAGRDH